MRLGAAAITAQVLAFSPDGFGSAKIFPGQLATICNPAEPAKLIDVISAVENSRRLT
jgi:hypothetical protein